MKGYSISRVGLAASDYSGQITWVISEKEAGMIT
jgi:hypothetical protein